MPLSVCVLAGAGVETAAMLSLARSRAKKLLVVYVKKGLYWEEPELSQLALLLRHFSLPPPHIVEAKNVYPKRHWSMSGNGVPNAESRDEEVMLPARNLLLITLALPTCLEKGIEEIWLGSLKGNPFPDAKSDFLKTEEEAIFRATGFSLKLDQPLKLFTKSEVIARFPRLPFHLTFSCIFPIKGEHCGHCNKCAERKRAFQEAKVKDPTRYVKNIYP